MPFENDGEAFSGTRGSRPVFSASVPNSTDQIVGEPNTLSLDFEASLQHYVQVADDRALDFGDAPFTIEAWVKLEALPTGNNTSSTMPVVMKKVIGAGDNDLDYMFLATAGSYGDATNFDRLALHVGSGAVTSTLAIPDTGWHFISVALDPVSDTLRFTLDDQVDLQSYDQTGTANHGPLVIGAHFNSSSTIDRAFDGLIDELSITDGFLPIEEVQPLAQVKPVEDFQILACEVVGESQSVDLTFESNDTRLYHIQYSQTLDSESWTNVKTYVPGATGATQTTLTDLPVVGEAQKEFYRVMIAN